MKNPVKLAVVGAGLVGQRHIAAIKNVPGVELCAVVEPEPTDVSAPVFQSIADMFSHADVDGVILSTPTPLHVEGATECVANGVPVLIEKPLAISAGEAAALVAMAAERDVKILVGHHRRYNPLIQRAAELISAGAIGTVRAAQATCWFYKPDSYFDVAPWRQKKGAGPISVNLVHDVDLMRYFLGEVESVQAQMAGARRGYENEDIAAAILTFENGAICTITVSDSIASPWSWELTSGEYPIYPKTDQSAYLIGGSDGALSIPDMRLWRHDGTADWWSPIGSETVEVLAADPLINQITHFSDVIRGKAEPLVSGMEGLRTLKVIEAIQTAAEANEIVRVSSE